MKYKYIIAHSAADVSLPVRGAWIEIAITLKGAESFTSLPVRGAWIEIIFGRALRNARRVAPRAGSVD